MHFIRLWPNFRSTDMVDDTLINHAELSIRMHPGNALNSADTDICGLMAGR